MRPSFFPDCVLVCPHGQVHECGRVPVPALDPNCVLVAAHGPDWEAARDLVTDRGRDPAGALVRGSGRAAVPGWRAVRDLTSIRAPMCKIWTRT